MQTTLVIPDTHDDPEVDKTRYAAIGNFIISERPDHVVQIGDFMSLDSISFHDHGRPKLQEGRRLVHDLESGKAAYNTLMGPLHAEWHRARSGKRRQYRPNLVWMHGNHEYRVERYLETAPVLDGLIDGRDLVGAENDGWTFCDFRDYYHIDGVSFTHCPLNPRTGKPLGGVYVAARSAALSQHTIVFGHTHQRSVMAVTRIDPQSPSGGVRTEGISVGCMLDHWPTYMAHNTSTCDWWEGLTLLRHYDYGSVDPEFISKEVVYRRWL